jgi:hypothetical protein
MHTSISLYTNEVGNRKINTSLIFSLCKGSLYLKNSLYMLEGARSLVELI